MWPLAAAAPQGPVCVRLCVSGVKRVAKSQSRVGGVAAVCSPRVTATASRPPCDFVRRRRHCCCGRSRARGPWRRTGWRRPGQTPTTMPAPAPNTPTSPRPRPRQPQRPASPAPPACCPPGPFGAQVTQTKPPRPPTQRLRLPQKGCLLLPQQHSRRRLELLRPVWKQSWWMGRTSGMSSLWTAERLLLEPPLGWRMTWEILWLEAAGTGLQLQACN